MCDKKLNGRQRLERDAEKVLKDFANPELTKTDLCHIHSVDPKTMHRFVDSRLGEGVYRSKTGPKRSSVAPKHRLVKRPNRYLDEAARPEVAARRNLINRHWPVFQNQY